MERARLVSELAGGFGATDSKITVAQLFERWLRSVKERVSPRTHERYSEIARKNLGPLIGQIPLKMVNPMTVSAAYATAQASGRLDGSGGLAPQTVLHMHRILHQAMSQAVHWQLISQNPLDSIVPPPQVRRASFNVYDLHQTRALLAALRDSSIFVPVLLSVLLGLRRGEISALRWGSINFDAGVISVVETAEQMNTRCQIKALKRKRERELSFGSLIGDELHSHQLAQRRNFRTAGMEFSVDRFVCARPNGHMMKPTWITHEWLRIVRGKMLPTYRFDDLRHTHAIHLLTSGVSPTIASKRLGYSSVGEMLNFYSDALPSEHRSTIAQIDALQAKLFVAEPSSLLKNPETEGFLFYEDPFSRVE